MPYQSPFAPPSIDFGRINDIADSYYQGQDRKRKEQAYEEERAHTLAQRQQAQAAAARQAAEQEALKNTLADDSLYDANGNFNTQAAASRLARIGNLDAAGKVVGFEANRQKAAPNLVEVYDESTGQPRKVLLMPDGTMRPVGGVKSGGAGMGNAPSGYRWSQTKPGELEAISGGPASKLPADVAGKVGMMRVAIGNLPRIRDTFLGPEGDVDPKTGKKTRKGANVGMLDYYATRGDIGEGIRLSTGAIESVLRAASGAAVPEQEVTRYQGLFMPTPYDTPETKSRKIDALENWIGTMLSAIQEGRPVALDEAHRLAQARSGAAPAAGPTPGARQSQGNGRVPPQAVQDLLADPSPEARREFEEAFGVPADQYLQGQ